MCEKKTLLGLAWLGLAWLAPQQSRDLVPVAQRYVKEELEHEGGGSGLSYSFDMKQDRTWREVGVDAMTGKFLENKSEAAQSERLRLSQARPRRTPCGPILLTLAIRIVFVIPTGTEICYQLSMNILVIEDDSETGALIKEALAGQGHVVDVAADGNTGLSLASGRDYDVAIVDRMLPGLDGLSLVKGLRVRGVPTAVLFLTNLGGIDDRVEGLEAGGDDYLVKPFAMAELLARVNALGRRASATETVLRVGGLELDLIKRSVVREGRAIDLQPREFRLLECLMRHAGRIVTRTMLLEMVWDFHFDPKTNIVETHISRLRAKVDRGFGCDLIHTERGSGYSLRASA